MTRIRPFFLKVSWVFLTTWSRLCRTNAHVRGLTRPEMSSTPLSDLRFRARFMPLLCHACFHSFRALLRPCSFLDMKKTPSNLSVKLSDSRMTWNKRAKLTNQRKTATGSYTEVNPISCSAFFNFDRPGKSVTWSWKQGAPWKHLTLEISVSIISVSVPYGNLTLTSHQSQTAK